MIVRKRPSVWKLFFIKRGSIFTRIMWRLLAICLLSTAVVCFYQLGHLPWFDSLSAMPFSLIGIALSIFLGFRNNACYDRWWEARKHWGDLIVLSRSNGREYLTLLPRDQAKTLINLNIAFVHALTGHLRDQPIERAIAPYLSESNLKQVAKAQNLPEALLTLMQKTLAKALTDGSLSDINYRGLTERLDGFCAVQTACERIRTTPTPFAYSLLLHRTAWMLCFLLPFGLVSSLGTLTPLLVTVVAYTYLGLDALGDELEEPFSLTDNGLPLSAMSVTIERHLLAAIGEPQPPEVTPDRYVLS